MYQFERVVCISLKRRPDRWQQFLDKLPEDWPFGEVERFDAIDGDRCPSPSWWNAGGGAWGCFKSHHNILEQCIQDGVESCMFLEDDAVCGDNFTYDVGRFLEELPNDWGMVYLGGQHLHTDSHPPVRVSENVYIPYNVNRTHALAIRGRDAMNEIYCYLNEARAWHESEHIDHHLGRLHERRELPIYCPNKWLIGQDEGQSNISGLRHELRFFPPATEYVNIPGDFVAIMGSQNSGGKKVAEIATELGLLTDSESRFGSYANIIAGGQRVGLEAICNSALPNLETNLKGWSGSLRCQLLDWVCDKTEEANRKNSIAFGAPPQFAAMGELLESTLQGRLKVISVDRTETDLIRELSEQYPDESQSRIEESVRFSENRRKEFVGNTSVKVLPISYEEISTDRDSVKAKVGEFLKRKF